MINGVSYDLEPGETLAILGESGSGKSVTAQAIMGILDMPPARIPAGQIRYRGQDLLGHAGGAAPPGPRPGDRDDLPGRALRAEPGLHGRLADRRDVPHAREGMSRRDATSRAIELMDRVKIPAPASGSRHYPHQFSGGMRQRVMIAMALALDPEVLIADEPTTALDVTVQAQIMDLLAELQAGAPDMGLILITHDLGVVADVADRIAVMYAGRIVEHADVHDALRARRRTRTPRACSSRSRAWTRRARQLAHDQGLPPNLMRIPPGCPFHPRCRVRPGRSAVDGPCRRSSRLGRPRPDRARSCHFARGGRRRCRG